MNPDSAQPSSETRALIERALAEDVGSGDVTSLWTVPEHHRATARIIARQEGVVAGIAVAVDTFRLVDDALEVRALRSDGDSVGVGDVLLTISGSARSILTAERVALNFLQQLSGVASTTAQYVRALAGTAARVLDTRKTTPGLRLLEKSAVRAGGASNHRGGLYDMVLIKENHIAVAGGISAAVEAVRAKNNAALPVEVETTTLAEVLEALKAGVDRILLDNMSLAQLREAVAAVRAHGAEAPELEASGGVRLETIQEIASTGVDFVSVGALTHSAPALDLSLLIDL